MSLVQFCCACRALCGILAELEVQRPEITLQTSSILCMYAVYAVHFWGVPKKVPCYLSLSDLRACECARGIRCIQIYPDVEMNV
jgi:hypothetical protein